MCWQWFKSLFSGGSDSLFEFREKNALLYAVNNFLGTVNDLEGCLNDMYDFSARLKQFDPNFYIKQYPDSYATRSRFKNNLQYAVDNVDEGTLFVFWMDCCHADSNTKFINPRLIAKRFYDPGLPPRKFVRNKILRSSAFPKWISLSGCMENQTSADAYFNGRPNGAFTFCGLKALKPGMTYKSWIPEINKLLRQYGFDQIATISGPEDLINRKVFEGKIMFIQWSGHGSYTYDQSGDEADGYDETLYMYDGMVLDDDLNDILVNIRT